MKYHLLLIMKHWWRRHCNKRPYFLLGDVTTRKLRCTQPIPQSFPISDLPLEILYNILAKLPPRTLGRLKLVCKAWRDAINNPYFVLHIHLPFSRKTRPFIVSFAPTDVSCISVEDKTGICNKLLVLNRPNERVLSTCNGLLCYAKNKYNFPCIGDDECSLYVTNPVTGEKIQLPSISCRGSDIHMFQVMWDEEIVPWGVLLVYRRRMAEQTHTLMFALGVDRAWRCINNPYKYRRPCYRYLEHPFIAGAIHRVYDNSLEFNEYKRGGHEEPLQFVAAFDIKDEKLVSFCQVCLTS